MGARSLVLLISLVCSMAISAGCGVRQYNAKSKRGVKLRLRHEHSVNLSSSPAPSPNTGALYSISSSQSGDYMSVPSPGVGCLGGARPCLAARGSVGFPYQFDMNSNDTQGPVLVGVPPINTAPGPYSTTRLPGSTDSVGPSTTLDWPRVGNRDLYNLGRQPAGAPESF